MKLHPQRPGDLARFGLKKLGDFSSGADFPNCHILQVGDSELEKVNSTYSELKFVVVKGFIFHQNVGFSWFFLYQSRKNPI